MNDPFENQRRKEDEELSKMSDEQRHDIENQLLAMTLSDALMSYPEGPRRRALEKLVCKGENFLFDKKSLLQKLDGFGNSVNDNELRELQSYASSMKVGAILTHTDQQFRFVANYLVATSV